jgi:Endonuclease/Exonuclease/phosphatase family
MKILSWNLNHRIQMKKIPNAVISIIAEISPDLVVLNEFVDGAERDAFKYRLEEIGFPYISVSKKTNRQNQVLIASKAKHEDGDLKPPSYDDSSMTNFLHVLLPRFDIEIVGLRAPAYKKNQELELYWSQLLEIISSTVSRNIVFIGDFNCNPEVSKTPGARAINLLREMGWRIPHPDGDWSYISQNGQSVSCLDYALGSPGVGNISGTYVPKLGSHIIAGPKKQDPISDHAILISEISPNKSLEKDAP